MGISKKTPDREWWKGKKMHFIGIKGIGISALAQFFFWNGVEITGSDSAEEFPSDTIFERLKIPVSNFSEKNISPKINFIIYSSAYNHNHLEVKKAFELGIPLKSYGEILAEIFNQGENRIVVSGSHGKTTTTALLGHLLGVAGFEPTVFVGGVSNNWQSNFKKGGNKWLITEGDEYQKKFLFLKPDYLLITNIDFDHPDCFKNLKEYQKAFDKLKKQAARKSFSGGKITPAFRRFLAKIDFPLLGEKNKENAFLVYKLAKELKIPDGKTKKAFETFKGVKRRMEFYSKGGGSKTIIVDDYAHHPEEIKATLAALKEGYPEHKIMAIFQPHTFSRTKALLEEFGRCFKKADSVYLLPTYASAREQKPDQNMDQILLKEVRSNHPQAQTALFDSGFFAEEIRNFKKTWPKLIVLTLGAGDVHKIAKELADF